MSAEERAEALRRMTSDADSNDAQKLERVRVDREKEEAEKQQRLKAMQSSHAGGEFVRNMQNSVTSTQTMEERVSRNKFYAQRDRD
jgi:uncharacterized protein YbjQ (UPF0145 family)